SEKGASLDFKGMEGEVAAVFGYADQVAPARILAGFAKQHEALAMRAGLLKNDDGLEPLTEAAIKALATLPTRDELRARVVGSLAAPLRNCVGVLQAPLRDFVQVMNAYAQSKS
ncbi:MAG: 50S ribosomal protein L10, partial [Patescibacteria group bacterium]